MIARAPGSGQRWLPLAGGVRKPRQEFLAALDLYFPSLLEPIIAGPGPFVNPLWGIFLIPHQVLDLDVRSELREQILEVACVIVNVHFGSPFLAVFFF